MTGDLDDGKLYTHVVSQRGQNYFFQFKVAPKEKIISRVMSSNSKRDERREAMRARRRAMKAREEAEAQEYYTEEASQVTRAMDRGNFPKKIEEQELMDSEPATESDEGLTERCLRRKQRVRKAESRPVSVQKIISIDTVDDKVMSRGAMRRSGIEITERSPLVNDDRLLSAKTAAGAMRHSSATIATTKFSRELTRIKSKISSKLHKQGHAKARLIKRFVRRQIPDKSRANAMTRFIHEEEERYRREQEQYYDRILDELAVTMGANKDVDEEASELSRVLAGQQNGDDEPDNPVGSRLG